MKPNFTKSKHNQIQTADLEQRAQYPIDRAISVINANKMYLA